MYFLSCVEIKTIFIIIIIIIIIKTIIIISLYFWQDSFSLANCFQR